MKISSFASMLSVLVTTSVGAQATDILENGVNKIQDGWRTWNLELMIEGNAILERAAMVDPENVDALYWHAYAQYRLSIRTLFSADENKSKQAEAFIDKGIEILETALEKQPRSSEHLALLATLTGMSIQFNPISGMWKGPASNSYFEDALAANPVNPRVMFLWGIGKLNTPSMFGGGADKALSYFETAIQLFEKESANASASVLEPRWGYDECCAFYGNALAAVDNPEKARSMYEKALTLNSSQQMAKAGLQRLQGRR